MSLNFRFIHKAIRSKSSILERLADIDHLCNEDWDSIIPDEIDSPFYLNFLSQLKTLQSLYKMTIQELCYVLRISSKAYYHIKNTQQAECNDENNSQSEPKVERPPIVTEEEEQAILLQLEIQQQIGDCFSPSQARDLIENYINAYITKKAFKYLNIE